ncbi:MAG: Glycine C-acetyltransferase [Parcubacteria group bacterium GW2011_GWB1_40_14]|nr:MAG: Glycine C-acetyltransferase [Parcubacteria group bacterium GW2011_GWB1_40_14]
MFGVVVRKVKDRYLEDLNGHYLYDFGTQDYLGIGFDQKQVEAAVDATRKYGTVVAWCRLVATVDLFTKAEDEIAKLVGTEASSIFASTTLLNHGVIPALMGNDGVMFLDKSAHATMYEGAKIARDSGATLVSFPQNDMGALEKLLIEHKEAKKKLIITDGVYSMTGDYADLPSLDKLAKKYDAMLFVDDAHGFGVVGEKPDDTHPYGFKGNGLVKYFGLDYDNILYVGCFSKAYGTFGAFVACSKTMKEFFLSQATPHDLGGVGPASAMAALLAGLEINGERGEEKRQRINVLTQKAIKGLKELGYTVENNTVFPIIYVKMKKPEHMVETSKILYDNHILLTLSPYPMVKKGEEGLRVTVTCTNTEEEIDQLIEAFKIAKAYLATVE